MSKTTSKKCPYCAEDIKSEASVCKHCKMSLNKEHSSSYQDIKSTMSTKQLHMLQIELSEMKKSVGIGYLLLFFLGFFGVHQFYLGNGHEKWGIFHIASSVISIFIMISADPDLIMVMMALLTVSCAKIVYDLFTLSAQTRSVNKIIEGKIALGIL